MRNEIFKLFNEFDDRNLVVADFGIKANGMLVTNIVGNDDDSVSIWSGDPDTDKHAEEIVLDDAEKESILKEVCDNFN